MRRYTAKVAALLVLLLVISACGRTGIRVSSSAEATAVPGAPVLMIRMDLRNDHWFSNHHVADYLSDGTVIRWPNPTCEPGRVCGVLERNTLTAAGLAAFRALLTEDADLLATPRAFKSYRRPGTEWSGRGDIVNTFVLDQPDGSRYTVTAPSSNSFDAAKWAPDPAIERLNILAEAMVDPVTLVGLSGLSNVTWETYRPEKFAVFISLNEANPRALWTDRSFAGFDYPDFIEADWPFESLPDTFGTSFAGPDGTVLRCGFVAGADIEAVLAGLPDEAGTSYATSQLAAGKPWVAGGRLWRTKSPPLIVGMWIVALLPEDGGTSCLNALTY